MHHLKHLWIFYRGLWSFIRRLTLLSSALSQGLFTSLLLDFKFLVRKLHSSIDATVRTLGVASSHRWRCTSLPNRRLFGSPLFFEDLHFFLKLLLRLIVIDITWCSIHGNSRFLLRVIHHDLRLLIIQRGYVQGIGMNRWVINVVCPCSSIWRGDGFAAAQSFINRLWSCLLLLLK